MYRLEVTDEIRRAVSAYGHRAAVYLYGSEARGDARQDADIDLLIVMDKDKVSLEDEMRLTAPLYEIELKTGILINTTFVTKSSWGSPVTPFYENVTEDAVAL